MDALKNRVICNNHFENCMFTNSSRSSLIRKAVPIKYEETTESVTSNGNQDTHAAKKFRRASISPARKKANSATATFNSSFQSNTVIDPQNSSSMPLLSQTPCTSFFHSSTSKDNSTSFDFSCVKVQTPKKTYIQPKSFNSNTPVFDSLLSPRVHFLTPTSSAVHTDTYTRSTTPTTLLTPKSKNYVRNLINLPEKTISCKRKLELHEEEIEVGTPKTKKIKTLSKTIQNLRRVMNNKSVKINRLQKLKKKIKQEKKK